MGHEDVRRHHRKKDKSNYLHLGNPPYLDLWDSNPLHVEVGIIIWRHPKYLVATNYENENDAELFSEKNWYDDFSPGGYTWCIFESSSRGGVRGTIRLVSLIWPQFGQIES